MRPPAPTEHPVALVTGAAGDLGGAIAARLATDGWSLALVDHPSAHAGLEATAARCRRLAATKTDSSPRVWLQCFDVTEDDSVDRGVTACVDAIGNPVAVVANAGVQGAFQRVDEAAMADVRRVLDVNIVGTINVLRAATAAMVAAGQPGAVVCMASMAGVSGAPNMAAYSASKAAVIGLVKAAAKDLAPFGIRVNAVSPAFIGPGRMWDAQVEAQAAAPSPYFADDSRTVAEQMIAAVPLRRYGTPQEVAAVVAFMLSADASYLTAINVEIAGGSA